MNRALPITLLPDATRAMAEPTSSRFGEAPSQVVHLLGRLDEDMFGLLGPATAVLAQSQVPQTLVLIDHPESRPLLARFDASIALVLVAPQRDLLAQWRSLLGAFTRALDDGPLKAVHLHGFVASLLGERALGMLGHGVPVFYSPHGAGSFGSLRLARALMRLMVRPGQRAPASHAIGNGAREVEGLSTAAHRSVRLVESPVTEAFFKVSRHDARQPLIVTASRSHDPRSVEAFDQLAVLLGGDALRLAFNWIGPVNQVSRARLKAANVGLFDTGDDAQRASRLGAAWVFVAVGEGGGGFPLSVAEAMAAGLPCVALDTPAHRDLVQQGETGYLCKTQAEVIDRIAQLIDTPSLRERMGTAGRALAQERFSERRFRAALFAAYDLGDQPALSAPSIFVPSASAALERPVTLSGK